MDVTMTASGSSIGARGAGCQIRRASYFPHRTLEGSWMGNEQDELGAALKVRAQVVAVETGTEIALRLAREVMRMRGLSGAAFNAAKEIALDHFMAGGIGFLDMAAVVEDTLAGLSSETRLEKAATDLEDVLAMDHLARVRAGEVARDRARSR